MATLPLFCFIMPIMLNDITLKSVTTIGAQGVSAGVSTHISGEDSCSRVCHCSGLQEQPARRVYLSAQGDMMLIGFKPSV